MTNIIPKLPEIKVNKNGFEIRSDVLGYAQKYLQFQTELKFAEWKFKSENKDGKNTTVLEFPKIPTADEILDTAKKFYSFVDNKPTDNK